MVVITKEDLKTMVEVEELLHNKLVETNAIIDKENGSYYFDENDKEYDIWNKYWNMVERFIIYKGKANERSAKFNKDNAEYHRLSNNLYWARKKNNKEKIEYYTKKIEDYKKNKGDE